MVDLHLHSSCSDGELSPQELVRFAKKEGTRVISLTDHDTVSGLGEAAAAAKKENITFIRGVEVSCQMPGEEVHILGYGFKAGSEALEERLKERREDRITRLGKIVKKLNLLNIRITEEDVLKVADNTQSVGRAHVARALVELGHVKTTEEAFDKFIASGRPAFVPKSTFRACDAIDLIHSVGGIASLAHPGTINLKAVMETIRAGVDAIEVYHPDHKKDDEKRFRKLAEENGLMTSGGSDFHGGRTFKRKIGNPGIGREKVEAILSYLGV